MSGQLGRDGYAVDEVGKQRLGMLAIAQLGVALQRFALQFTNFFGNITQIPLEVPEFLRKSQKTCEGDPDLGTRTCSSFSKYSSHLFKFPCSVDRFSASLM